MPIYDEYECPEHGLFERKRDGGKARRRAKCPVCRQRAWRRLGSFNVKKPEVGTKAPVPRSAVPQEELPPGFYDLTMKDITLVNARPGTVGIQLENVHGADITRYSMDGGIGVVARNSDGVNIAESDLSQTQVGVINQDSEVNVDRSDL